MAFMEPDYYEGTMVETNDGLVPRDEHEEHLHGKETSLVTGCFYRLSASGYMDCTEWTGPFETEALAREDLSSTFDCDPDTGDDLEESDDETPAEAKASV